MSYDFDKIFGEEGSVVETSTSIDVKVFVILSPNEEEILCYKSMEDGYDKWIPIDEITSESLIQCFATAELANDYINRRLVTGCVATRAVIQIKKKGVV